MALPAALVALIIISLLVTGSAFFTLQEARTSRAAWTERTALEAAEYGVSAVLRDWDPALNVATANGASLGPFATTLSSGMASALVTRLTPTTYWVVSTGTSGVSTRRAEARRTVQALLRLDLAMPVINAALTVRDSASVVNGGVVSGTDTTVSASPIPTSCANAGTGVAGVAASDTTHVCDGNCGGAAGTIRGTPRLVADALAADSMRYLTLGGRTTQSLTAAADVVLPPNATITPGPVTSSGLCQRGITSNWGDPSRASVCGNFFPVIWARGDLTITGGAGQGLLIVDGSVRLDAGATFFGLVVARGDVLTLSGGGTIIGTTMAAQLLAASGHTQIGAASRIQYSRCALERALYGSAPLRRVMQRAWMEFF